MRSETRGRTEKVSEIRYPSTLGLACRGLCAARAEAGWRRHEAPERRRDFRVRLRTGAHPLAISPCLPRRGACAYVRQIFLTLRLSHCPLAMARQVRGRRQRAAARGAGRARGARSPRRKQPGVGCRGTPPHRHAARRVRQPREVKVLAPARGRAVAGAAAVGAAAAPREMRGGRRHSGVVPFQYLVLVRTPWSARVYTKGPRSVKTRRGVPCAAVCPAVY